MIPIAGALIQTGPGGAYTTSYLPRGSRLLAVRHGSAIADLGQSDNQTDSQFSGGSEYQHFDRSESHGANESPAKRPRQSIMDRLLGIDRVDLSPAARAYFALNAPSRPEIGHAGAMHDMKGAAADVAVDVSPGLPLREAASGWLAAQIGWLASAIAGIQRMLAQVTVAECRHAVVAGVAAGANGQTHIIPARPLSDRGRNLITRITLRAAYHAYDLMEDLAHESHPQATEDSATDSRFAHRPGLFADDAGTRRRTRHQQGDRVRTRRIAHQKGRFEARSKQGTLFVHL